MAFTQWHEPHCQLTYLLLDVYLYIVVSPLVRGFPAYLHVYVLYPWPLAPMKYNQSIPNMVSERVGFPHPPSFACP
jgi:hypothetical protein